MNQFFSILVIVLFWIISFVEPSGWAALFHLSERINALIVIISIALFFIYPDNRLPISQGQFWLTLIFLVLVPYINSSTWQGASYSIAFLVTYIVSQCRITKKVVRYTSWAISTLGLGVLYVYTRGSILSGWNDNAMSMAGLFSYLYFSIFLISKRGNKSFWMWNIVTIFYLMMLFETDCRSGMLFSILAVASIYYSIFTRNIIRGSKKRLLLLNIPFIVSLIAIYVATTPLFDNLNQWSLQNYDKSIFNGREFLWGISYEFLRTSNYMGTGKFMVNYHNSGVAALSVFGIIGYICWIKFFNKNLYVMSYFISDEIVFGSMLAFLIIYLQQSVDLGFISDCPNLLPYMILGIGLGRVRLLQKKKYHRYG